MKNYAATLFAPCSKHTQERAINGCLECADRTKQNIMVIALHEANKPIKSCLSYPSNWKWHLQNGKMKERLCHRPNEGSIEVPMYLRSTYRSSTLHAPLFEYPETCCWEHALETWKRAAKDWELPSEEKVA